MVGWSLVSCLAVSGQIDDCLAESAQACLASALGVERGLVGCHCVICGSSPYAVAGSARTTLRPSYGDWEGLADREGDVCVGCARCLAGRPSREDPPLRMGSVVLTAAGELRRALRAGDLWPYLLGEEPTPQVISWSCGWQLHHWIHAGHCSEDLLVVGSDHGPIEMRPLDRGLLRTVAAALAYHSRKALLSGEYHPTAVARQGFGAWRLLEQSIRPHRGRGLLALACAAAPKAERGEPCEEDEVIEESTRKAAGLLALIAWGSSRRARDGKAFWGGYYLHRIRRFSRLPLAEFVDRLLTDLLVNAAGDVTGGVLAQLDDMSDEDTRAVERALRKQTTLCHHVALRETKKLRESINAKKERK